MDYSKLSDYEINKLVAYQLGYTEQGEGWIDNADGIYWYILKPEEGYRYSLPNYCKSWAEGGPIISANKISVEFYDCGLCLAFSLNNMEYNQEDNNPLRAAMIVFLKLKGVV